MFFATGGYYPGLISGLFFIPATLWLHAGRERGRFSLRYELNVANAKDL
jgi:hypothetical protein